MTASPAPGTGLAPVVPLRPAGTPHDVAAVAARALAALGAHLGRCQLAAHTVRAYRRQAAYTAWLAGHPAAHPDAFTDVVGAEAAVTAWRRQLLTAGAAPSSVNQGLAAVSLLYEHGAGIRIAVKRARVPRPGEPGRSRGRVRSGSVR